MGHRLRSSQRTRNGVTAALCCHSGYSCDTALPLADVRFSDCYMPIPATMTNVITETTYVNYNPLLAPAPSPPVNVTNAFGADSCSCIRASAIRIEWAATDSAVLAFERCRTGPISLYQGERALFQKVPTVPSVSPSELSAFL
jgi:hypothetical protein